MWWFEHICWTKAELKDDDNIVFRLYNGHPDWPFYDPVGDCEEFYPLIWVAD